ncbi:sensor histidine kinase [Paenibacillus sp. sgz302251]|uniref:sensor histidine kinase n=1 Tax=Paenibacillus sp. sgz302251 TaxID=3414493 RepID=UPI003C7CBF3E
MTIRTKLLIFIPLLVLLVNSVTFFLFQSGKTVQQSYYGMFDRIMTYGQAAQAVDDNLQMLYIYLINPEESQNIALLSAQEALRKQQAELAKDDDPFLPAASFISYSKMIDSFLEQEHAAHEAMTQEDYRAANRHYAEAEKTAAFIQEEGQQIVDRGLSYYQPIYAQMQSENERMNSLAIALFIVTTLLSVLIAVWISRSVTGPVSLLVARAKQISKGNLRHDPPSSHSSDELGVLSGAFEQMSSDLALFIEKDKQSLEKDRLVKALELQALQSQINPHFLFNTLNSLSKLALLEGAEQTSDLIVSMSNLLRYNLRNLDQPVTLREEIQHVKEYFIIQQARFRDRIKLELFIDPAALVKPIPALTLQPLVENAFIHGIEQMEIGAVIKLTIAQEQAGIRISVSDNGRGMSEATRQALLQLQSGTDYKQSTGLGTKNVFKRLYLFYGMDDLISIESELGKGTTVTILIPDIKEGEFNDVPTVNRG